MACWQKRVLGDFFGLKNFGVNLTTLTPGASSSLHHRHSRQDEFLYVVAGEATLVTDTGETPLRAGMCAGFPAGGTAHHLQNRAGRDVVFLEIGDRTAGDDVALCARVGVQILQSQGPDSPRPMGSGLASISADRRAFKI